MFTHGELILQFAQKADTRGGEPALTFSVETTGGQYMQPDGSWEKTEVRHGLHGLCSALMASCEPRYELVDGLRIISRRLEETGCVLHIDVGATREGAMR